MKKYESGMYVYMYGGIYNLLKYSFHVPFVYRKININLGGATVSFDFVSTIFFPCSVFVREHAVSF